MAGTLRSPLIRVLLMLLTFSVGGPVQARHPQHLQNVGLSYGPIFRSHFPQMDRGWELSYDRMVRTCLVRKPFWSVAVAGERNSNDPSTALSARFAMSPYRWPVSRRVQLMTLLSMRFGRWSDQQAMVQFIRPEIGMQVMVLNALISPKITMLYGREVRIGGGSERDLGPLPSGVFTVQAGVSVNFGTLAYQRRLKAKVGPLSE